MTPRAIAGDASTSKRLLDSVPGLIIDKGFVGTVVDHVAVTDLSDVIRVAKHPMDLAVVERGADVFDRGATLQATLFELIAQFRDAPVSRGVRVECPANVQGTLLIDSDTFDLTAFNA